MKALEGLGRSLGRVLPRYKGSCVRGVKRAVLCARPFLRGFLFGQKLEAPDPPAPGGGAAPAAHPRPNPLLSYFEERREGRVIWKWRHYFEVYHRHLARFTGREPKVLEIGVGAGGSLEMWRSYFGEGCRIFGADIDPACRACQDASIRIFIGDQADRAFWRRFREEAGPMDVVIDDGGHRPRQQIIALEELLPSLRPGGVYLCEDVHGVLHGFRAYVDGMSHLLNALERSPEVHLPNGFQRRVHSVHQYPFVTVIEMREERLEELTERGPVWGPVASRST